MMRKNLKENILKNYIYEVCYEEKTVNKMRLCMGSHVVCALCLRKNRSSQTIEKYPKSNNTIYALQKYIHVHTIL